MITYLVTGPDDNILDEIKNELIQHGVDVFDAKAAKNARNETESDAIGLTRVKPTETADTLSTQCHAIAGYHDTDQVFNRLADASVIIIEPEASRILADMFPERQFEIILPHAPHTDIEAKLRFQSLLHIDQTELPDNLQSTTILTMDDENTVEGLVEHLLNRWTQYDNVTRITERFVKLGILDKNEDGTLNVLNRDANGNMNEPLKMSIENFVMMQIDNEKRIEQFLCQWMTRDRLKLTDNVTTPKFVILGRTGTGKNHLAMELQKFHKHAHDEDMNLLRTVTTRPQRSRDDDNYHFITQEQADAIPDEHKALHTRIGPYEYFARKEDLEAADIMILDPSGLREIIQMYPEQPFFICYVSTEQKLTDEQLKKRNDDVKRERERYEARYRAEDETFTQFERDLGMFADAYKPPLGSLIIEIENDFKPDTLKQMACNIIFSYQTFRNLQALYPVMCSTLDGPSPSIPEINNAAANLLLNPDDISDFMFTATLKMTEIPFDEDYRPDNGS